MKFCCIFKICFHQQIQDCNPNIDMKKNKKLFVKNFFQILYERMWKPKFRKNAQNCGLCTGSCCLLIKS